MRHFICSIFCAIAPAAAMADACLTGVWQADVQGIAASMAAQMGGSAEVVGGGATMVMAPGGQMNVTVADLTISVTPPNVPTMDVTVTGFSRGTLSAEGGRFNTLVAEYSLVGSALVFGERMTIPFDSTTGLFGTASGTYTCSGDSLQLEPATASPQNAVVRSWRRIG